MRSYPSKYDSGSAMSPAGRVRSAATSGHGSMDGSSSAARAACRFVCRRSITARFAAAICRGTASAHSGARGGVARARICANAHLRVQRQEALQDRRVQQSRVDSRALCVCATRVGEADMTRCARGRGGGPTCMNWSNAARRSTVSDRRPARESLLGKGGSLMEGKASVNCSGTSAPAAIARARHRRRTCRLRSLNSL